MRKRRQRHTLRGGDLRSVKDRSHPGQEDSPSKNRGRVGSLWRAAARQLSVSGLKRTPPIWREARMVRELAKLRRHPISDGVGLPRGDGQPVFLIPGYMTGDASLAPMARALRAAGYRPETAG